METFKKTIDYAVWVIFFLISVFVILFLVSMNAVPGEFMFGTKLGLEKIIALSSRILNNQVDAQMSFVSSRLNETTKTIDTKYASDSLKRLDDQVDTTATIIEMIPDPVQRKQAAQKYVAQLNDVSTVLSQQQQKYTTTATNTTSNYQQTQQQSSSDSSTNQNNSVSDQISTSQQTVDKTITTMNNLQDTQLNDVAVTPTSEPTRVPTEAPTAAPTSAPTVPPTKSQTNSLDSAPVPTSTTAPSPTPHWTGGWHNNSFNNNSDH